MHLNGRWLVAGTLVLSVMVTPNYQQHARAAGPGGHTAHATLTAHRASSSRPVTRHAVHFKKQTLRSRAGTFTASAPILTDAGDTTFSVVLTTTAPTTGSLAFGAAANQSTGACAGTVPTGTVLDNRDVAGGSAATSSTIHRFTLTGLTAGTAYCYQPILNGTPEVNKDPTNPGGFFPGQTSKFGPTPPFPPKLVTGSLQSSDNTPLPTNGVLVLVTLSTVNTVRGGGTQTTTSVPLSLITTTQGTLPTSNYAVDVRLAAQYDPTTATYSLYTTSGNTVATVVAFADLAQQPVPGGPVTATLGAVNFNEPLITFTPAAAATTTPTASATSTPANTNTATQTNVPTSSPTSTTTPNVAATGTAAAIAAATQAPLSTASAIAALTAAAAPTLIVVQFTATSVPANTSTSVPTSSPTNTTGPANTNTPVPTASSTTVPAAPTQAAPVVANTATTVVVATETPTPSNPVATDTAVEAAATDTAVTSNPAATDTAVEAAATETPAAAVPTDTAVEAAATDTAVEAAATETPAAAAPTDTAVEAAATDTAVEAAATETPVVAQDTPTAATGGDMALSTQTAVAADSATALALTVAQATAEAASTSSASDAAAAVAAAATQTSVALDAATATAVAQATTDAGGAGAAATETPMAEAAATATVVIPGVPHTGQSAGPTGGATSQSALWLLMLSLLLGMIIFVGRRLGVVLPLLRRGARR